MHSKQSKLTRKNTQRLISCKNKEKFPLKNLVSAKYQSFWTYLRSNGNRRKHRKTSRVAGPYLHVSASRTNEITGFRYGISRFRNINTRWRLRKYVIPETEICRKHVKKCSGSVENAATETWETVMYPLTETRVCCCVSATESSVSTMFKFTDTWFFVLCQSLWVLLCTKEAS